MWTSKVEANPEMSQATHDAVATNQKPTTPKVWKFYPQFENPEYEDHTLNRFEGSTFGVTILQGLQI